VVLFVLTLLVNAAARVLVRRSARPQGPGRGARRGGETDVRAVAGAAAGA